MLSRKRQRLELGEIVDADFDARCDTRGEVHARSVQPAEHGGVNARVAKGKRLFEVSDSDDCRPRVNRGLRGCGGTMAVPVRLDDSDQGRTAGALADGSHVVPDRRQRNLGDAHAACPHRSPLIASSTVGFCVDSVPDTSDIREVPPRTVV